jgi:hypothetical protein
MADPSPTGGGTELGRFLRARRAQISPADVGLPVYQGIREDFVLKAVLPRIAQACLQVLGRSPR